MIVLGIGVLLLGIGMMAQEEQFEYIKPDTQIVKEEVVVSELETRIEEAKANARIEIEQEAQTAYDTTFNQAMLKVELEETAKYRAEIQSREEALEKEVGVY